MSTEPTEYTPSTNEVREQFAVNINRFGDGFGTKEVGRESFDAWLTDHDAKIKAEAYDQALEDVWELNDRADTCDLDGGRRGVLVSTDIEQAHDTSPYRADRIEQEAGL